MEQDNPRTIQSGAQVEQALVNRLAREFLAEQRSARRWNIAFKLFFALIMLLFLLGYLAGMGDISPKTGAGKHTALVDVQGIIAVDADSQADYVVEGLRAAYQDEQTAGVIIRINSPGGSPVQAGYVNDEIQRLKSAHPEIPVYAVISDVCASGGYYIAVAADHIYADKASLVGSIGVVMAGFGFVDALEKLGIERRVYHAGEDKAFLDPFAPLRQEHVKHLDQLLDGIYQQFVQIVKQGRGERLADDERIFSGLIWTGEQAVELGLVDGLGSAGYVARELIGAEDIVDFTHQESLFEQFIGELDAMFARRLGEYSTQQLYNLR